MWGWDWEGGSREFGGRRSNTAFVLLRLRHSLLPVAAVIDDERGRRRTRHHRDVSACSHPPPCPSPTWGEGTLGHWRSQRHACSRSTVVAHHSLTPCEHHRAAVTSTVPVAVRPKRSGRYMSST
jgi:hypothetical protein